MECCCNKNVIHWFGDQEIGSKDTIRGDWKDWKITVTGKVNYRDQCYEVVPCLVKLSHVT